MREQEYRQAIASLKKQIDDNSSKPLEQMKVVSEEELVLKGLRLKLKKNVEPEPPQKNYADRKPDQRAIEEMHEAIRGIEGTIVEMK